MSTPRSSRDDDFGPNFPGYEWKHCDDASPREIFPGITSRSLWQGRNGAHAVLIEIAPGAAWGTVDHHCPGPEEVYVSAGVFNDGVRDYPAGTFLHAPAGSRHIPQSQTGCTLFVFYPES